MKKSPILALLGLALLACAPSESTSGSTAAESPSEPSDSTSSTPSSPIKEIDVAKAIAPLTESTIAFKAELDFKTYYSLSGNLHSNIPSSIESVLTPTMYHFAEFDEDGYYQYIEDYADDEGNMCQHVLYPDNTIGESLYTLDGEYVPFAEYYVNPFIGINEADYYQDGEDLRLDLDKIGPNKATAILMAFTGYEDYPFDELRFDLGADGVIVGGSFSGKEEQVNITQNGVTSIVDVAIEYSFRLVGQDELTFEPLSSFPSKPEDAALQALFDSLKPGNYTLEVTRIGGSGGSEARASFVDYYTEDTLLHTQLDKDGNRLGNGYHYVSDKALVEAVTLTDGELVGTGIYQNDGVAISDFVSSFAFSPAVFDYVDGKYVLKSGYNFERYLQSTSPDQTWNYMGYLAFAKPGYAIELTDDGAKIAYDYGYTDPTGTKVEGRIEMVVKDIGTTELDYPYVPYVPNPYDSWDDLGEEQIAIMKKYLGEDYLTLLPYVDIKLTGVATLPKWNDAASGYANIALIYSNEETLHAAHASFLAELAEIGYQEDGMAADDFTRYALIKDGVEYSVGVKVVKNNLDGKDRYFYIRLYPMAQASAPSLVDWLTDSFSESVNGVVTTTKKTVYYHLLDGGKGEYYQDGDIETDVTHYTDSAYRKEGEAILVYDEGKQAVDLYFETSTGELSYQSRTNDVPSLEEYALPRGYFPPNQLLTFLEFIEEDGEGGYGVNAAVEATAVTQLALGAFGDKVSGRTLSGLDVDFNGAKLTLSFTVGRVAGSYYVEDEYSLSIDKVGEASIDLSNLPPMSLNAYFSTFFASSDNSLGEYRKTIETYALSDGAKGELLSSETFSYQAEIDDTRVQTTDDDGEKMLFVEEGGQLDIYSEQSNGGYGDPLTSHSDITIADYFNSNIGISGVLFPSAIAGFASYLSPVSGMEETYDVLASAKPTVAAALLMATWREAIPASAEITALRLTLNGQNEMLITLVLSETVDSSTLKETTYTFKISSPGEIDLSGIAVGA